MIENEIMTSSATQHRRPTHSVMFSYVSGHFFLGHFVFFVRLLDAVKKNISLQSQQYVFFNTLHLELIIPVILKILVRCRICYSWVTDCLPDLSEDLQQGRIREKEEGGII